MTNHSALTCNACYQQRLKFTVEHKKKVRLLFTETPDYIPPKFRLPMANLPVNRASQEETLQDALGLVQPFYNIVLMDDGKGAGGGEDESSHGKIKTLARILEQTLTEKTANKCGVAEKFQTEDLSVEMLNLLTETSLVPVERLRCSIHDTIKSLNDMHYCNMIVLYFERVIIHVATLFESIL